MGKIKNLFRTDLGKELLGQGIGAGGRFAVSVPTTDLGAKIFNTIIGGAGMLINEKTKKNELFRKAFTHMFYGFADPTANQLRGVKRSWDDMVAGLRMGSFGTAFNSLIEEPQEVISAWSQAIPKMGNLFSKLGNGFSALKGKFGGRFQSPIIKAQEIAREVTPEIVTSYGGYTDEEFIDY